MENASDCEGKTAASRENGSNYCGKKEGIGEIFEPNREHAGKVSARLAR